MSFYKIENYSNDMAYTICKVIGEIEETSIGTIYEVAPKVRRKGMGKTRQICRVASIHKLKIGRSYVVVGKVDTLSIDSVFVPVLVSEVLKLIPSNIKVRYEGEELVKSYLNFNCAVINNLKVVSVVGEGKRKIIKLVKFGEDKKFMYKTELVGVTVGNADEVTEKLSVGDVINIVCGIDRIEGLNKNKRFEVGLNIFEINPSEGILEEIKFRYDNLIKDLTVSNIRN